MTKNSDIWGVTTFNSPSTDQIGENNKAIVDFENTYPTLAEAWKITQQEQYELFAKKMMDYGLGNISLGTNLEEPEDINLSLTGTGIIPSSDVPVTNLDTLRRITPSANTLLPSGEVTDVVFLISILRFGACCLFIFIFFII